MTSPFATISRSLIFAWILVLLTLSLILKSCLYSDDIYNYQKLLSMGPISLGQILHVIRLDMAYSAESGRFTPLALFLQNFILWLSSTILIYKLILFAANILAVFTFTRLLRAFGLDDWIPFSLLLFCATAQFYIGYHDSFTSFHAMFPLLAVFIFSSASSFISFLKNGKIYLLMWSLVAAVLAILDYEIGLIIFPILLLLLAVDSRRISEKLLISSPFIVVIFMYTIAFIYIRTHAHSYYGGVETNFDISAMLRVLFFQLMATIPLTGFAYLSNIPGFLFSGFSSMAPVLILSIVIFYFLLRSQKKAVYAQSGTDSKHIWAIALVLWICPALILMISKKYQAQAIFGKGYLPVYIQNFGLLLLTIAICHSFLSSSAIRMQKIRSSLFILVFIIFVLDFLKNDFFINTVNANRAIPACFYYKSLKNGILSDCESGAVIVLKTDYYYHAPLFYQAVINNLYAKNMHVVAESDFVNMRNKEKNSYYMLEHNADGQYTILYRIQNNEKKELKRYKYPAGRDFSYFDLISKPL